MLSLAPAVRAAPPAPLPIEGAIAGLDVHEAARLLARVYEVPIVVAGGTDAPLRLPLADADAATAIGRLAAAAGLVARSKPPFWLLAPPDQIGRLEGAKRGLPAGPRIDLDLELVEMDRLFRVLADVLHLRPDGAVAGRLSVFGKKLGSIAVTTIVSRLAGLEASRHEGRLVVGGAVAATPAPPVPTCEPEPPLPTVVFARCVDPRELDVLGWAARGGRTLAAVRARTAHTDGRAAAVLVAPGDRLGRTEAAVARIDGGGVALADGTTLPLAPAPR